VTQIFINYRRADTKGWAARLHADLENKCGAGTVFLDLEDITPGRRFDEHILERLKASDVVLIVIGPSWLPPSEYVIWEIAQAIAAGKRLIPVLVDGARMPAAHDLPEEIQSFAKYQAIEMSDRIWAADLEKLVEAIDGTKGRPGCGIGVAVLIALLAVAVWYWLQPRENVYLSKKLELSSNFQSIVYREFGAANGTRYKNGVLLASLNHRASTVKYRIPRGMRKFVAQVVSSSYTCDEHGDLWTVTVEARGQKKTHTLSHHHLDPLPVELPVDSFSIFEPRVLTITVDPHQHRFCDHSALGDPHFSPEALTE
jgi:hypothetical protein